MADASGLTKMSTRLLSVVGPPERKEDGILHGSSASVQER